MDIEYVDSLNDEPVAGDFNQIPVSIEPKRPLREDLLLYRTQRSNNFLEISKQQPVSQTQSTIKPIKKNKKRKSAEMVCFASHDEYIEHK